MEINTIFFNNLKSKIRFVSDPKNVSLLEMYRQLFLIFPKSELNELLEGYYGIKKTKSWFAQFHKALRQTDVYTTPHNVIPNSDLKPEEVTELETLDAKANKVMSTLNKEKVADEKWDARFNELMTPESRERRIALKRRSRATKTESICGHIDMMLWLTIDLDEDDLLYDLLKDTFEDYADQLKSVKAKEKAKKTAKA